MVLGRADLRHEVAMLDGGTAELAQDALQHSAAEIAAELGQVEAQVGAVHDGERADVAH